MEQAAPFEDRSAVDLGGRRADRLFEVLAHPYRRFVLWYLWEADGRESVRRLASELRAWSAQGGAPGRGVAGRSTITLSLRHTHLPKLADADLVAVDGDEVVLVDGAADALVHVAEVVER